MPPPKEAGEQGESSKAGSSFQFVDWSDVSGPNRDPATRVMIRKQAMSKVAAARKERGDWGKRNLGQSVLDVSPQAQETGEAVPRTESTSTAEGPTCSRNSSTSGSDAESKHGDISNDPTHQGSKSDWREDLTGDYTIPPNMPSTGYEMLRMESNFDMLDLSALTTFHVGRITTEGLYNFPAGLVHVLECRQWSYFSFIPSRFGHITCLDDAARCVASRVRGWLSGDVKPSRATLSLYSKALGTLQAAVNDPFLRTRPETLCAILVLSIYELLDNEKGLGWAHHAAGARSLVKLRGSQCFQTTFERALLMAQVGAIYTECIADNLDCFLQDPDWQAVLQSVLNDRPADESPFSDRGPVVMSLWSSLVRLPSLWKDVQAAVCNSDFTSTSDITSLQSRAMDITTKLTQWRSTYEPLLLSLPLSTSNDARAEKRFETLGMCLTCMLVVKRLTVALDPLAPSASETEEQVQVLADQLVDIEVKAMVANPRAALFMKFKKVAALATKNTTEQWHVSSPMDTRIGVQGMIAKWVFENWCSLKGRKV